MPPMVGGSTTRWRARCGGRRWRQVFLAYFTTHRANNGGTVAINGIIERHRRLARGYRNRRNYRLRMLLAAGGLEQ